MITCPTCGGRGDVLDPRCFWVQLREFGEWSDYLDYQTLPEAIEKAESLQGWENRVRIVRHRKIVWKPVVTPPPQKEG